MLSGKQEDSYARVMLLTASIRSSKRKLKIIIIRNNEREISNFVTLLTLTFLLRIFIITRHFT